MADITSPTRIRALLARHSLRPRKRWGQHFLADHNTLTKIVSAGALGPAIPVLEIGPGLGALTRELAANALRVTAVEIDPLLEPVLGETLRDYPNAVVKFGDFLEFPMEALVRDAFGEARGHVVANIPYNITTPILERLFTAKEQIARIVLLVQKELAERLAAFPGTKDYGSLSVFAQFHAIVRRAGTVPRTVFIPPPEVESAIVVLEPLIPSAIPVEDPVLFERCVGAAFAQRRKTLGNALAAGFPEIEREEVETALLSARIDPARRGETLAIEEFARVADSLSVCLKGPWTAAPNE